MKALDGVDTVIHTAGVVSYGVFPDHDRMQRVNVDGKVPAVSLEWFRFHLCGFVLWTRAVVLFLIMICLC